MMTDEHLVEFTHCFGEHWRRIPAYLEMKRIVVKDAERTQGEEEDRRLAFFSKWKLQKGTNATYERLVYALLKIGSRSDAEAVCKMLTHPQVSGSGKTAMSPLRSFTGKYT